MVSSHVLSQVLQHIRLTKNIKIPEKIVLGVSAQGDQFVRYPHQHHDQHHDCHHYHHHHD